MGVLSDVSLTAEEIDFLTSSVLAERIANEGDVQALDRVESPSFNYFMSKAKDIGAPANGAYKFLVKANTNRKLQWWSGADILTFESKAQLSDLTYEVGKCHMGNEIIYEALERQGVKVDYRKGINRSASPERAKGLHVTASFLKENFDDYDYNWQDEMRKAMWLSNAADPKAFAGFDSLFSVSSNTSGLIGKRDRSNLLFRHQLVTAITKTNFQLQFQTFIRNLERRAQGKKVNAIFCGDSFYDMLADLFSGTDTVAGKFDYRAARDKAMALGEKMNIALPQEAFVYRGTLVTPDPVFEILDRENPGLSAPWGKRLYAFAGDFAGFMPVIEDVEITWDVPYNQRLQRISKHGEAVCWCSLPSSVGAMVLN